MVSPAVTLKVFTPVVKVHVEIVPALLPKVPSPKVLVGRGVEEIHAAGGGRGAAAGGGDGRREGCRLAIGDGVEESLTVTVVGSSTDQPGRE